MKQKQKIISSNSGVLNNTNCQKFKTLFQVWITSGYFLLPNFLNKIKALVVRILKRKTKNFSKITANSFTAFGHFQKLKSGKFTIPSKLTRIIDTVVIYIQILVRIRASVAKNIITGG